MKASKMYSEMSLETDEFFKYMVSGKLMDLETKRVSRVEDIVHIFLNIMHHLFSLILIKLKVMLMF